MSSTWIEGGPDAAQGASAFEWTGGLALERVHALNERCLEVLCEFAGADDSPCPLTTLGPLRSLWRDLDTMARKRAAHTPFLLVDVHFRNSQWWCDVRHRQSSGPQPADVSVACMGTMAGELMRETLMLAWNTVALERRLPSILFGMTPAVATVVAQFDAHDVECMAAQHSEHLRPRWEDFPAFWVQLLTAAREGDEQALHRIHIQGIQLMGRDLLPLLDGRFV